MEEAQSSCSLPYSLGDVIRYSRGDKIRDVLFALPTSFETSGVIPPIYYRDALCVEDGYLKITDSFGDYVEMPIEYNDVDLGDVTVYRCVACDDIYGGMWQ